MLPIPKICAAISKEKRRGVLMVKSGIKKMKIHKKSVNIHSVHLTRVNFWCIN